jgi:hypothetical protein
MAGDVHGAGKATPLRLLAGLAALDPLARRNFLSTLAEAAA